MYGGFKSKLRGLRHVYVQYLGKIPEKIELYNAYNDRECLHCHAGDRTFEEGATHNMEDGRLNLIKSNQLSCLSTECHEVVHNVSGLKDVKFWSEGGKEKNEGGLSKASYKVSADYIEEEYEYSSRGFVEFH